jgi:NADPH-dependent 2,4-dienoyl-CoA reductase/sulfur reductase-like enzyme/rhodanese-related sulfurtransferase
VYNVIIIGGMAAGCKAASRLNRLCSNYHITILEKKPFISVSNCGLPLHAAGDLDDFLDLAKTPYGVVRDEKFFHDVKGIEVLTNTEVKKINEKNNEVVCFSIEKNETFTLKYDALILATGSEPKIPDFSYPSSSSISFFHSPLDSRNFREAVQKGKVNKAVIIGGSSTGCELIEALTSLWGIDVTLIENGKTILSEFLDSEISLYLESCIEDKARLMLSSSINKIEIDDEGKPVIFLNDNQKITTDYVFLCPEVKPDTNLAVKSNLKTGKSGGILVDDQMRTNLPNVWAAGDCVEIKNLVSVDLDYFPSGSLANKMGRVAADSVAGMPVSFKGSVGTFSLKVFDNVIGAAGLTEKKARKFGFNTSSVISCCSDKPEYHPEAKKLFGKLIYEKQSLKLLGLQLIGEGEVSRCIDVFSELLRQRKTVTDLIDLEHCHTPAHSAPISPLNFLGYMAFNQEIDGVRNFNPLLVSTFNGKIIDVRESNEVGTAPFPKKSIHIPLEELRLKLNDFDLTESILFICGMGSRGYEAARFFHNSGYKNVTYLGGGNLLYSRINEF